MLRSAFINTFFSIALKVGSFAYTLLIVGVAARSIASEQTGRLLLAFGYLAPLGLVQAGIGSLVLRSAMHNYVTHGSISKTHEIGLYFRFTTSMALIIGILISICAPIVDLGFIIPTSLIMLIGIICSVADQVWFATERSWVFSLCLTFSFVIMSTLFAVLHCIGYYNLSIISIVTYCVPSLASIISFAVKARDPVFQRLLFSKADDLKSSLKLGAPMFLASIASSILVTLPTVSTFWHALPSITAEETPLFRLATISANLSVSLIVPFLPWLVFILRNPDIKARRLFLRLGFAILIIGTLLGGGIIIPILPWIVRTWIGFNISGLETLKLWAFVIALWISAAISGQISLMMCDAMKVAFLVAICDAVILLVMTLGIHFVSIAVSHALVIGLALHTGLALILLYRTVIAAQYSS